MSDANPIRTLGDYSKLDTRNAKESWALLEDLALYDNESWNDPRDLAKPVKEISLHQDVPKGLVSNFMAYQDARLSKFEADFKQQQSEMNNKIDTVLKAITDRLAGSLPSDMVKNPKLSASPVYLFFVPFHQDESIYDAWARFKNLIQRVPHHGLDLWSLTQFFYDHVDEYTRIDLDFVVDGNLRKLSGEEA
ncbi:hypothetical protein Tco_0882794 [Tanacetum coccineum]